MTLPRLVYFQPFMVIHGTSWLLRKEISGPPFRTWRVHGGFLDELGCVFCPWTRQLKSQVMDSIFSPIFSGWPTNPKSCETTFPPNLRVCIYTLLCSNPSLPVIPKVWVVSRRKVCSHIEPRICTVWVISSIFMASEATSTRNRVLPLVFQIPGAQTPLEALPLPKELFTRYDWRILAWLG